MKIALMATALVVLGCGPKTDVIAPAPTVPSAEAREQPRPLTPEEEAERAAIAKEEQDALAAAMPVFEKYCARCHSSSGEKANAEKLEHFSMDEYPFGGEHAFEMGRVVRDVLGVSGGKATMPMGNAGAVQGAELDAVVVWSRAFDKAHAAGVHDHHKGHGGGHGRGHGHGHGH